MTAQPSASRARPACPHRRLRRLLARELPSGVSLGASTLRPWASASFIGARHSFLCGVRAGDPVELRRSLAAHLERVEWCLAGHIVADFAVEIGESGRSLCVEMLSVED